MKVIDLKVLALIIGFVIASIESQNVSNLMTLLKNVGEKKLEQIKNEWNNTHICQFLVVSVLSESEMKESKNWQHLPDSLTESNRRVDVIFNDKNYYNFPFKTKKPLHGEVLMLYDRQDLRKMINNLNEEQDNANPYVVLYSHYIPCCGIKGIEYSCAEELKNAVKANNYNMLVGYNKVFSNTNSNKSKAFMSMGGIQLFKYLKNGEFQPEYSNDTIANKPEGLLQDFFYKCLNITPVSDKCTVDKSSHPETKRKILAMYVNAAIYSCTTNDSLKNYAGELTPALSLAIMQCIFDYVDSHTGQDCQYCSKVDTIYSIKVCVLYALIFSTEIGRPSNLNDPYIPVWEKGPVVWGSLYQGYNVNALENRPAIFCLKTTNEISSLCTKNIHDAGNTNILVGQLTRLREKKTKKKTIY